MWMKSWRGGQRKAGHKGLMPDLAIDSGHCL